MSSFMADLEHAARMKHITLNRRKLERALIRHDKGGARFIALFANADAHQLLVVSNVGVGIVTTKRLGDYTIDDIEFARMRDLNAMQSRVGHGTATYLQIARDDGSIATFQFGVAVEQPSYYGQSSRDPAQDFHESNCQSAYEAITAAWRATQASPPPVASVAPQPFASSDPIALAILAELRRFASLGDIGRLLTELDGLGFAKQVVAGRAGNDPARHRPIAVEYQDYLALLLTSGQVTVDDIETIMGVPRSGLGGPPSADPADPAFGLASLSVMAMGERIDLGGSGTGPASVWKEPDADFQDLPTELVAWYGTALARLDLADLASVLPGDGADHEPSPSEVPPDAPQQGASGYWKYCIEGHKNPPYEPACTTCGEAFG